MTGVVHIVGTVINVGPRTRQCCGWCGMVLINCDRTMVAAEVGQDPTPPHFPPGVLLLVDGHVSVVVEHQDGDPLPDNACAVADPAATAEHRALAIADRIAAEEPTAGAGRVTRRFLAALLDAGLISQKVSKP